MSTPTLTRAEAEILVAAASKAPSVQNTQPWAFVVAADHLDVNADPDRWLRVVDAASRELHISCGAAVFNAEVAARHLGYEPVVRLVPEPTAPLLLARISLVPGRPPGPADEDLYAAIPRRHTNREPFEDRAVPADVLAQLIEAARLEGALLHLVTRESERRRLAELAYDADIAVDLEPEREAETRRWVTSDPARPDGVPEVTLGPRPSEVSLVHRDFLRGQHRAGRRIADFETASTLAVLLTPWDHPADWLRAGVALERVLLVATTVGLSASFVTQALERTDLRWLVRDPLGPAGHPQMLMRVGYGGPVASAPRRPLDEVSRWAR